MAGDLKYPCQNQIINEWVKGKVIGSGSFGTVNLAVDKATGSLFVVKSSNSSMGIEALKNEANILESLNSPHVVRCIKGSNNGEGKGNFGIFLEYMAGGSLSNIMETFGGLLDEKVIKLYTKKVLQGLNYIHSNGIVHCDLKCENVLVGSDGEIKLADFGYAKRINNSKRKELRKDLSSFKKSNIRGTPLWMAPEVLKNEGVDFVSDIWSLGCMVIEMATGRPPWSGSDENNSKNNKNNDLMKLILKIACGNEKPQFPKNFSQEGLDFLRKCFERNPKKRPSADELTNHPFIMRENENAKTCNVCSPSSVLEIGKREGDEYEYEYEDEDVYINHDRLRKRSKHLNKVEFFSRKNPFSTRMSREEKSWKIMGKFDMDNNIDNSKFWSSEDWITVR